MLFVVFFECWCPNGQLQKGMNDEKKDFDAFSGAFGCYKYSFVNRTYRCKGSRSKA